MITSSKKINSAKGQLISKCLRYSQYFALTYVLYISIFLWNIESNGYIKVKGSNKSHSKFYLMSFFEVSNHLTQLTAGLRGIEVKLLNDIKIHSTFEFFHSGFWQFWVNVFFLYCFYHFYVTLILYMSLHTHCYFIILNSRKKGTFKFCLPALLGIHRNSKQKEFFRSSEGFLR